uniref:Uncharacterized protein n=1 Tax=viral metagenome TaxID=1070528 RepID=A0A6C0KE44_9ZZZZ
MFQRLNVAAGVLHTILFAAIVITDLVLRSKGRSQYKLRFWREDPDVPDAPDACRGPPIEPGACVCESSVSEFCEFKNDYDNESRTQEQKFELLQQKLNRKQRVVTLRLATVIAAFPLITALFHFYVASPLGQRGFGIVPGYAASIASARNPFRWVEYSITASVMIVAIAGLSDVTNIGEVICIFALMMGLNILGLGVEDSIAGGRTFTAVIMFNAAVIMFMASFYSILTRFRKFQGLVRRKGTDFRVFVNTFFSPDSEATRTDPTKPFKLPAFVAVAVYGIALLYVVFPLILLARWAGLYGYEGQEKGFLVTSLVAKAFLVIAVASGIAREDPPDYAK